MILYFASGIAHEEPKDYLKIKNRLLSYFCIKEKEFSNDIIFEEIKKVKREINETK